MFKLLEGYFDLYSFKSKEHQVKIYLHTFFVLTQYGFHDQIWSCSGVIGVLMFKFPFI